MRNQKGQVAVEYILLVVIVVALYLLIQKTLVSRDPSDAQTVPTSASDGNSGAIIRSWNFLINAIGQDLPDDDS